MLRRAIFALVLFLTPLGGAQAALLQDIEFGRYHALVIGINAYKNLPRLETAVNDASAVADLLRQKYGFEVTLLLNPGRSEVIRALDRLRGELTESDNLLIYYAGHGVLDVEADAGFWMSVDAEESTQADWISVATITSTVRAMSAKHVMVVSDSCYSGRLTRGLNVSIKSGSERVDELTRLAAKRSRTALVSGGLEPVSDGGGQGHSVFTRAFLTALRESDEVLDGQQLFTAVRRPVIVNADQTPEYSDIRLADHQGGDFLFVPVGISVTETITGTAPREGGSGFSGESAVIDSKKELAFWEAIKDSNDADMFRAYLESYPNGTFAQIAKIKINQIDGSQGGAETEVAVVIPPIEELTVEVEDTDITLFAVANANVRARPATSAQRLDTIPAGAAVAVTGKVLGADWYRVALAGGVGGYVFAPLLRRQAGDVEAAVELAEDAAPDATVWAGRTAAQRAIVARWQQAIDERVGR